ncbi:phytanoyl-CoA dioxygenase family protein [Bordetella hinzii]|uniref:phytanoyl-CoA dioxygenase family protein n=1 Tax=Bordetella hinzii TaxID=103855 RepID=UPI0004110B7A|nr:phytanoyl-CoA dioxygenase family protein [Bordetella hinzii]AKQ53746.1 Phytanoyl-CoA dioxygenase (PhyH) [Bordetella hinzii]KCB33077.1 phytanoyl-CoA dioxygenase PhyH [Bordetella hinzii L60]KCB38894.1 phytanoyl-CoA dioxygenase PhyH [Bordetella hinzii CA90 BAL1384]KCB39815.1 phytanoyl-CoA dioxygenase PhyH [Bordetella hinzii 5132]QDJ49959.1 phytanoyl-CoA dioxygenase [Bordetella hinzii]
MSTPSVADLVATLRQQGFVVARNFASPSDVQTLRAAALHDLEHAIAPIEYEADLKYPGAPASRDAAGGLTVRRLLDAYGRGPRFRQWATQPALAEVLRAYYGGRSPVLSTVHHNCIMTKHPMYGSLTGWHQDIRYWSFSEQDLVSCWLALGPETPANGGLFFLPGSHAAAYEAECFDGQKFFRDDLAANQAWIARAVSPELAAGDVVFFHCRTLHAAQQNRSQEVKLSLVHTYYPEDCHPLPGSRSASRPGVPLG